jgi:hypothetical protein
MDELDVYPQQNWLITPAALALNQPSPQNIHYQKWLLDLSGIVLAGGRGKTANEHHDPHPRIQHFVPDFAAPCHYAISNYQIPRPPGNEGSQYRVKFQVDQSSSFLAVNRFVDYDADYAHFSIDGWQLSPFLTGTDMFIGPVNNLFDGITFRIAIGDHDTRVGSVSFNIRLLGQIAFPQVQIE